MRRNTSVTSTEAPTDRPADVSMAANPKGAMAVIALSLVTVVSAVAGLNIALPEVARTTGATQTQLTWIVDAYTIVFAALLFFAGALGDRYGRKPLLIIGLTIFGVGALAGALVTTPEQLIAVRAFMGLGAAGVMPTTLSVITTSFPEKERPRAVGAWVGIVGAGAVFGIFASALLLERYSWNSFFWLNVGLAIVAIIGTILVIPNSVDEHPPALDFVGATLSLLGVGGVIFGIIEGPERGWTEPITLAGLTIGVLATVGFVLWELRREQPLLDPRLFRNRGFSTGTLALTVSFFAWFGLFFALLQYLQFVAGLSPLKAAAAFLPIPLAMIPTARWAPRVADRIGFRRVVPVGLLLLGIGLAVISLVEVDLNYPLLATGLLIGAAGMGMSGTPSTTAITASLPLSKQGIASAMNDTSRELGSAIGIAILGSTINQVYRSAMEPVAANLQGLPDRASDMIMASVAFTQSPELAMLGERGQQLADTARQAFVDGTQAAMLVAAITALVTGVIVFVAAPRKR